MQTDRIKDAENEAKRFLTRVAEWRKAQKTNHYNGHDYPIFTAKECGAVRRSSMDLTRALAAMRKP